MKINMIKKGLALGVIILFIGAGIIPSTIGINETKAVNSGSPSRGYIQGLIDNASAGDTIYIPSGTYYEHIHINKRISLVGEDKNTTIIDGGGSGNVVWIWDDEVKISGFTIQNGSKGFFLYDSNKNTIKNNNIISNTGPGIYIERSNSNTITSNNIASNNHYGIYLKYCSYIIIKDNIFFNDGLYIDRTYHNSFENNSVNGKPLVYLEDKSNQVITDAGAVILINCNKITLEKLNLSNTDIGIQLLETKNCNIKDNSFSNDSVGIQLEDSNHNTFTGNTIASNSRGAAVLGSNFNSFTDNTVLDNEYGIYLGLTDPPSLTPSKFTIFKGNTISNNGYGIILGMSSVNTITGNTISNNQHGIWFIDTTCSFIIKNNFIDNEQDAYFKHHIIFYGISRNRWIGNYWGKLQLLPKPINGTLYWLKGYPRPYEVSIDWIQIDWRPTLKPYVIP